MDHSQISQETVMPAAGRELDLVGLLVVLAKNKKKILAAAIAGAVVSAGISLTIPNEYRASTKLLPPQQTQSSANALLSQLGGIAGAAVSAAGMKNPSDLYVGMLRSRTVADRIIAQFELKKVYDTDSQERARKLLQDNTTIAAGKDSFIVVDVLDKDKKRVAAIANAYVSELFRLMKTLAVTDAGQRRLFYERQLESTKDNLAAAEIALKKAMDSGGVISVDTESRAALETTARLKAQISAKEIQLTSMRAFVTNSNPDYRRVEEELNGLRTEMSKLENGRGSNPGDDKQRGLENIKLMRDLKYQQMLYEVLAKQYEVARIDEAKDPSVIQVLDPAVEPERKAKPWRALIVLISTVAAAFLVACWVVAAEASKQAWDGAMWEELKSNLSFRRRLNSQK
jgi:uncharacterized protein involved in exopolysaccharide biosynthesis